MSYNSSFTGQQADAALQKAAIIQTDGGGTQFLGNDGVYHDISSLPTINQSMFPQDEGTLSSEDLQKFLAAGAVGTAIVLGSTVAGSWNSGIAMFNDLTDEMYMSYGVTHAVKTIDDEDESTGKGQATLKTYIVRVNKTTGVYKKISASIHLDNTGDGTLFLASDGMYKAPQNRYLDMSIFTGDSGILSDDDYQKVVDAYNNKVTTGFFGTAVRPINIYDDGGDGYLIVIVRNTPKINSGGSVKYDLMVIENSSKSYIGYSSGLDFLNNGDGTKFLSDDGTYKAVSGGGSTSDNILTQEDQDAILDAVNAVKFDEGYNPNNGNSGETKSGSITSEQYNSIINSIPDKVKTQDGVIWYITASSMNASSGGMSNGRMTSCYMQYTESYIMFWSSTPYLLLGNIVIGCYGSVNSMYLQVNSDYSYTLGIRSVTINTVGDGTKFLSDDGSYKSVSSQPMQVLTESEYAALGDTVNTDGVLYFVKPDDTTGEG